MNIFKRIFKVGEAETHSLIDKLEDPIKMTEQGIRDMKKNLDSSLQALAEVKALAIRTKNDKKKAIEQSADYERKAMLLLQKAQNGGIDSAEADRLASEALLKKDACDKDAVRLASDEQRFEVQIVQLDASIKKIRSNLSSWENELNTLKARVKVSNATKSINKQLSRIDGNGTVSMLERMKEKVAQDEALAEAYGEIAHESKSLDEEIDKALDDSSLKAADSLASLKAKMGISGNNTTI